MPRAFDPAVREQRFVLSNETKKKIVDLINDLDSTAKDVVELAVAHLWQRELGEPERDVLKELDEMRKRLERLEAS